MSTHAMNDRQAIDQASAELTPIPLMQIITGFWAAKTLAAAVERFCQISRHLGLMG
jgi:hypothetical protein